MFRPDSQILIAAHKYAGASDIMSRVRYAYEMLPSWIKAGVTQYNRNSIEFDNGSKISATTAAALEQLKIIGVSRDPDHSDTTEEGFALRVMINEHILGNNVAGI